MKQEANLFKDERLMLAFAFMADVESGKEIITKKESEAHSKQLLNTFLSQYNGTNEIFENWELIFGPVLYTHAGMSRNATCIFYNKTRDYMVIAVAGTNFINKYDWFTEDIEVSSLVPWNSTIMEKGAENSGPATGGYIAKGTATALQNTWSTENTKYFGHSPITWLKKNIASYNPTTLAVTGHSLGGAIAPVLATALNDNLEDWNGNNTIKIKTFIFAGPTPGDEAFKAYAESKVNISSVVNKMDVVPHAWDLDKLDLLYSLYAQIFDNEPCKASNNGRIVYWTIRYLIAQSTNATPDHIYKRWSNEEKYMINKSGELIPTAAVSPTEAEELLDKIGQGTVNQLYNLTGAKSSAELTSYTQYFLRFMSQLGKEHTEAYQNIIFDNNTFQTSLKAIFKVSAKKEKDHETFDALEGGLVLQTLIATIDWFYIQTTQLSS